MDNKEKELYSTTTTKHGEHTTKQTKDPSTTTTTQTTVNGFYNPDGSVNQAAVHEFDTQKNAMAQAYGIDQRTGRIEPKYISDILGVEPEIMRQRREKEKALNKAKKKESAWYNVLSVLGDMAIAAGGGNVWQRKADNTAKEADERIKTLEREQQADDAANKQKVQGVEQAYAHAVQKLRESIGKEFGTTVQTTEETGGTTTSITTRGDDKNWVYKKKEDKPAENSKKADKQNSRGSANRGTNGNTDYLPIKIHTANGQETSLLPISAKKKEAIANQLANVLEQQPEYVTKYAQYVTTKGKRGEEVTTIDIDRLVNDGVYMNDPYILNIFISELQHSGILNADGKPANRTEIYEMITGQQVTDNNGKVLPERVLKGVRLNGVDGTYYDNGGFNPDVAKQTKGGL